MNTTAEETVTKTIMSAHIEGFALEGEFRFKEDFSGVQPSKRPTDPGIGPEKITQKNFTQGHASHSTSMPAVVAPAQSELPDDEDDDEDPPLSSMSKLQPPRIQEIDGLPPPRISVVRTAALTETQKVLAAEPVVPEQRPGGKMVAAKVAVDEDDLPTPSSRGSFRAARDVRQALKSPVYLAPDLDQILHEFLDPMKKVKDFIKMFSGPDAFKDNGREFNNKYNEHCADPDFLHKLAEALTKCVFWLQKPGHLDDECYKIVTCEPGDLIEDLNSGSPVVPLVPFLSDDAKVKPDKILLMKALEGLDEVSSSTVNA